MYFANKIYLVKYSETTSYETIFSDLYANLPSSQKEIPIYQLL